MSLPTDTLNEARRDLADVLEEIGAVAMHLREAIDFADSDLVSPAAASVDDAQNAIDETVRQLAGIRDKAGRWAVWAEDQAKPKQVVANPCKPKDSPEASFREASVPSTPKWMAIQTAANWSGFSDRMIEELARTGQIVSSNVIQEGKSRGRRLILVESLDAFIMAGIARPPAELAMNVKRAEDQAKGKEVA
jgi:hypothetical protein